MGLSQGTVIADNITKEEALNMAIDLGLLPLDYQFLRISESYSSIKRDEIGLVFINNQAVIISEPGFYTKADPTDILTNLSKNRKILFWMTVSAIDGIWYSIHENGQLTRMWVKMEGEIQINEGSTTVEMAIEDASDLMEFAETITGVTPNEMFDSSFEVYAATP